MDLWAFRNKFILRLAGKDALLWEGKVEVGISIAFVCESDFFFLEHFEICVFKREKYVGSVNADFYFGYIGFDVHMELVLAIDEIGNLLIKDFFLSGSEDYIKTRLLRRWYKLRLAIRLS